MTAQASPLALARLPEPPNSYDRTYQVRLKNVLELESRAAYFGRSFIIKSATEQSEAVTWFNG